MSEMILETTELEKYFNVNRSLKNWLLRQDEPSVQAVDKVNIEVKTGESIGVIGESGCGKTTLLRTLMGLYDPTGGDIVYDGRNMSEFTKADWKAYRKNVQIIFQDPFNAINPKMKIIDYLMEPLKLHGISDRESRIKETLEQVELRPPDRYLYRYPDELSGGELQRVGIARALVIDPDIILADEPVSMLDVSTQAAVLKLLSRIQKEYDVSIIYISHDLSTVSYVCDRINVMYLGRIVEQAPTRQLLDDPKHPYSQALIDAIPRPNPHSSRERTEMDGSPRDPIGLDDGCRFRDRCSERMPICETQPEFVNALDSQDESEHYAACHLYYDHEQLDAHDSRESVVGGQH
ncbi:ABC transporter ATP-binding protein [Halobellus captivus]|uniref:ABC transporter ATP-binding protein n=1 Tax=Halobellus captivus TaxID=2592614 RepID=UPI0011A83CDE|nr:ABC transporter ATP-binding protein [Halobellus captivus]